MEHEPYLEEEHKDQLCKKDCKRIAGSLLFYYILLFACAFTLGIISSAYIMSGASQTELETITNIFSMIATCFVTILTLVIYKKKLHVTIPYSLCKEWNFLSILRYTIIAMGLSGAAGILIQLINQILIHFGWVMTTPDFSMKPDITYNLSIVLSACIIAPIMEELLSRIDTANAEKIWKCLRYSCDKSAVCIAAWKSSAECPCFCSQYDDLLCCFNVG